MTSSIKTSSFSSSDESGNTGRTAAEERVGNGSNTPSADFLELFSTQSLMSHNNNIAEFSAIKEAIENVLTDHRSKSTNETVRKSIPKLVVMTTDQSPHLPGIVLYVRHGKQVYLMPVLFYKKGVVDMLEDYQGVSMTNQPTFSKFAETFMNKSVRESVKSAFQTLDGKPVEKVFPISNYVIDVGNYLNATKDEEFAIRNIADAIMTEWYNGMINFTLQLVALSEKSLKVNPFRDKADTMFGKDNTALARIDVPEYPLVIAGRIEPYNLMVKLIAAPKGDYQHGNLNSARSVATTYLNVDLELMNAEMFRREFQRDHRPITRGPLIPVISIGKTIPGQQLQHNDSFLTEIIGIYNAVTVNNPLSFSEAFRHCKVGSRGSLANLAIPTYAVAGDDVPAAEILTTTSMLKQKDVQQFMEGYIAQRAVFVKDLATYVDSPANSEIWWNVVANNAPGSRVYKRAFLIALDKLSGGRLQDYENDNKADPTKWVPGKKIMTQSTHIVPVGTGVIDNQVFNFEEIGQMMLHDPRCYGDNEQAVSQFMSLLSGSCNKELRVRQYEIKRCLEELFGASTNLIGFKSRWTLEDNFLNAVVDLVGGTANIQVTSSYGTRSWESLPSNDYLLRTSTAVVRNGGSISGTTMTANTLW